MSDAPPPSPEREPTPRPSVDGRRGVLSLVLLHVLLLLPYPWEKWAPSAPPGHILALLRVATDLALIIAVGGLLARRFGTRAWLVHGLTVLAALSPLTRFGVTVMPVFYGKPFDLYNDVLMVPSLVHLLLFEHPFWLQAVLSISAAVVAGLVYVAFLRAVRASLALTVTPRAGARLTLAAIVLAALAGVDILTHGPPGGRFAAPSMLAELTRQVSRFVREWQFARAYPGILAETAERQRELPPRLGGLGGADVHVIFVESYGRSITVEPNARAALAGWSEAWQKDLADGGLWVASSFTRPWISGGSSSLAHAAFLSGVLVHNRRAFDDLLESEVRPLPHVFADSGYRTLNVQPATTEAWDGSRFFGFQEDLFHDWFEYEGLTYHWGWMPDQYALAKLYADVVATSETPLFTQYISVTSHAPFNLIPPYYEDWSLALEPGAFDVDPVKSYPIDWTNYAGHPDVEEAFLDTIEYSLRTAVDFARSLTRPSLVLILGDHQPPYVGEISDADDSFDVPIHAIANRQELLLPFGMAGFVEGFLPPEESESFDSAEFVERFRTAFGSGLEEGE